MGQAVTAKARRPSLYGQFAKTAKKVAVEPEVEDPSLVGPRNPNGTAYVQALAKLIDTTLTNKKKDLPPKTILPGLEDEYRPGKTR